MMLDPQKYFEAQDDLREHEPDPVPFFFLVAVA